MRLVLICFALGCALLQTQAVLPAWPLLAMVVGGALILLWAGAALAPGRAATPALTGMAMQEAATAAHSLVDTRPLPLRSTCCFAVAAFLLGFVWAGVTAHWRLHDALPAEWEGRDIEITGVIASLPQPFERGVRFEFEVDTRLTPGAVVPRHLQLAWYGGFGGDEIKTVAPVHAGERWRLTVRLRKPHGNANPHGFDYEAWLLERGVRATGYVRPAGARGGRNTGAAAAAGADAGGDTGAGAGAGNIRLEPFVWSLSTAVDRTREIIRARLLAALDGAPYAGVIVALAVGDQRAIDSADWELFARTGVSHLMSISGLHVTMIAGLGAWFVFALWRRSERLTLWLPAPKAAAAAGALTALLYCLLAGWGVPAQRTLYMLLVAAYALWRGWFGAGSRVLAIALGVVCVLDPWAPLSAGFWLSFGAVALLLLVGNTRSVSAVGVGVSAGAGDAHAARGTGHWLATAVRAQVAITLGLTPLTLALFGQVSIAGPLANALAIPVVSFIVTPLALAAAVVPFDAVASLAHWVTDGLMAYLEWLNGFEGAVWQRAAPPLWAVLLAMLGACWCLIPLPLPWRAQGVVWMLPLVLLPAPKPGEGDLWLTVLDVGQGLAMVARTREHTLLYDTGPRYSPDADSGNRVVVPFLRGEGVNRLDGMVVTHDDIDHSGGALSVLRAVPTGWISSPLRASHPLRQSGVEHRACTAGQRWEWDGVVFEMLHPRTADHAGGESASKRDNAMSCVLRVSAQGRSALLTADIETDVEALLVASGAPLRSNVMIAPHHGSKTSSTAPFLAAVTPQTIVIPVGYRNRFRHPAPEVLERYRETGARLLRTDAHGAVTLRFTAAGVDAEAWRTRRARYWHAR